MNKRLGLLVGAALLGVAGLATADSFYMGAGVGALQLNNTVTDQGSTNFPDDPELNSNWNVTATGHGTGVNGTLVLGYAWENPNDYFIGVEAFQNMSNAKATATLADADNSIAYHMKIKDVYGVRVLPGYHFTPDTVGYGILGLAHGKMQLTANDDDDSDAKNYDLNGYQVGAGMMTKITPNIAVRGDLIYTGYAKSTDSIDQNINGDTASDSFSIKPSTMEANIDLMYSFG